MSGHETIIARLFFPVLQLAMLAYGLVKFINGFEPGQIPWFAVAALAIADLGIALLTFAKVRHVRS